MLRARARRLPFIVLLLAAWPLVAGRPLSAQEATSGPGVTPGVRVVNRTADALRIEIRAATGTDCSQGRLIVARSVAPGSRVVLHSSRAVCLRSEKREASGATRFQPWQRVQPARGTVMEVVL